MDREPYGSGGGHKSKIFRLTKPLSEIIDRIENEKKIADDNGLNRNKAQ